MSEGQNALQNELVREAAAVRALMEAFSDGDDDFANDIIEGETSFKEAITRVLRSMDEDDFLITGIKSREEELGARRRRIEHRKDVKRAAIEQAMAIAECPPIELPDCTLSMKAKPQALVVTDEAMIPADYWKRGDPKLDRKALLAALKDNTAIPGATLSNGGRILQVRTK